MKILWFKTWLQKWWKNLTSIGVSIILSWPLVLFFIQQKYSTFWIFWILYINKIDKNTSEDKCKKIKGELYVLYAEYVKHEISSHPNFSQVLSTFGGGKESLTSLLYICEVSENYSFFLLQMHFIFISFDWFNFKI